MRLLPILEKFDQEPCQLNGFGGAFFEQIEELIVMAEEFLDGKHGEFKVWRAENWCDMLIKFFTDVCGNADRLRNPPGRQSSSFLTIRIA